MARQLRFRRVRGIYEYHSRTIGKPTYERFTKWVARETFGRRPDLRVVRIDFIRTHITLPWEPDDPMARPARVRKYRRHEVMP